MKIINSEFLTNALISGVENLNNNLKKLNDLNVFPVPDGDTGSNMSMTADSGFEYIYAKGLETVEKVIKQFAKGLLMGARGNSGVIFSQVFKGLSNGLSKKNTITPNQFAKALKSAKEAAYKSVSQPLEGTILTVIREISEAVDKEEFSSFPALFDFIVFEGEKSLSNTPNLLKPLKDAGVVDSGGAGLLFFFKGMRASIHGSPIKRINENKLTVKNPELQTTNFETFINYGYCTEFMNKIKKKNLQKFNLEEFQIKFSEFGDSIVVVQDEDILKTHIHTKKPAKAMAYLHRFGEFIKIKIENMSLQAEEVHTIIDGSQDNRELKNEISIVSSAPTKELADLMKKEYGVSYVIDAKNPSTKEFLTAIERVDAKNVIVVPNNGDAYLSARQAKKAENLSQVHIIKTKNVMEGLIAFVQYSPDLNVKDLIRKMKLSLKEASTALVSVASKNANTNGIMIKAGQAIGLLGKEVVCSSNKQQVVLQKLAKKILKDKETLTIIIGQEHDMEVVNKFKQYAEEEYDVEVDIIVGNQPVYNYILGAE